MHNFKQRIAKSNNLVINHVHNFTSQLKKSEKPLIMYCILCKYVIQIHVLVIYT